MPKEIRYDLYGNDSIKFGFYGCNICSPFREKIGMKAVIFDSCNTFAVCFDCFIYNIMKLSKTIPIPGGVM